MWGTFVQEDEWTASFGPGERCPKCRAPDWHPDPQDEYVVFEVCESCGYEVDQKTGEPPDFKKLASDEQHRKEESVKNNISTA